MIDKIIYENERGFSIELNHDGPLFLFKADGFDGLEADVNSTQSINQDGITINSINLKERPLALNCYMEIDDENQRKLLKDTLNKVFALKSNGKLTAYIEENLVIAENTKVIQAPLYKINPETTNELVAFQIQLISPSSFFVSGLNSKIISTWTGGMAFKFSLPFKLKDKGETKINIYNEGHVDTPVRIIFGGPAVNPVIYNRTTGEFIKVKTTLLAGEKLIINTEYGNKTVEIDRSGVITNAFNLIDLDSTFFSLVVGDNLIEYTTDNINDTQQVEIQYKFRYIGV